MKECNHKNHIGDRVLLEDNFGKDKQKRDGLKSYCKTCCSNTYKLYYSNNKEKVRVSSANYYSNNSDQQKLKRHEYYHSNPNYFKKYREDNQQSSKEYQQKYRETNKDKRATYAKEYYKTYYPANKSAYNHYVSMRRARLIQATPDWCEVADIKKLYNKCSLITNETDIQHHVDHIIPLASNIVCGLHCLDNLQILSKHDNLSKGNKLINTE